MANRSAIWDFIEEMKHDTATVPQPDDESGHHSGDTEESAGDTDGVGTGTLTGTTTPSSGSGPRPGPQRGSSGDKPISAERILYDKELAAVKKLRTALGKHTQAAHVKDKTDIADRALTEADAKATANPADWTRAMAELASAKRACEDAKPLADRFADFMVKRAEANLVLTAVKASGWTNLGPLQALLNSADAKAAPTQRHYDQAKADLDGVISRLGPKFKQEYVDKIWPEVNALESLGTGSKFIAAEISELKKMMTQQETGITAKQWRVVRLNHTLIRDKICAASKMANRRTGYETERPNAERAIKALSANGPAATVPAAKMQERLHAADAKATKASMQFEDATAEAKAIVADCQAFGTLAQEAQAYYRDRGSLSRELSALRGHAAAAKIAAELDVVKGLLDEAVKAAGDTGAPGTPLALTADRSKHDLTTANARLAQARANLADARTLANGLGGVAVVERAVQGQLNMTDLRKALDALGKELEAARNAPHADLAATELGEAKAALDDAKKQIDAKQPDLVKQAITTGTAKLTAARHVQVEHARYVDRHDLLKRRLGQLNGDPSHPTIQEKITVLDSALKEAETAEAGKEHAKAMTALDKAETAAGAADAALTSRKAFDTKADQVGTDLNQAVYDTIKGAQTTALGKARELATAFDFAGADKALAAIRNKMAAAETLAIAKQSPPTGLADKAQKLYEAGGTKELDDLIQSMPDTTDNQVLITLAQARYKGVTFQVDDAAEPQMTIKRMCELMHDVPEEALVGNPSLKKITRNSGGKPVYHSNDNEVEMNKRPGVSKKPDFKPGGVTGRLPPREGVYAPANNDEEDLFDFNMLHELAHSIDDARNFMGQHGSDPNFGGWIEHGGKVDTIIEAVIKETGFGTTPEERKYVEACLLQNPAEPPATYKGDKARFEQFLTAALKKDMWSSQALSEQATLDKRVYQQSYANRWTSYLADARKKGITGYQFRAPGEWFAELYAAWKRKKLQPGHPAITWLEALYPKKE
jgi:hypothetical protein